MAGATNDALLEMQRQVVGLAQTLGRVEGKVDTFIAQMKAQDDRTTELEVRTRKVENRQHWYSGVAAAIGALLGLGAGHGIAGH